MSNVPKVDVVIDSYLRLRKTVDEIKDRHKAELAPHNEQMQKLEAWLQMQLLKSGTSSLSAKGIGTAFLQNVTSVTVEDWQAQLEFIKQHEAWEMLEHRVSKSAVQDYITATGNIPPGLSVKNDVEVRIRKG